MNVGDSILTVLVYAAGGLLILALPIALIIILVKNPIDFMLRSWADAKYRAIENAMKATERIKLDDGTIILKRFTDGRIDYKTIHAARAPGAAEPQAQQATATSAAAINAARWIVMSYATSKCDNDKHRHGPHGNQLLTQDESIALGVFGSPRDWQAARDWMREQWLVTDQKGTNNPGTFTDGTLSDLLTILTALPQRKQ